jgi:REP element-mobilizing transposase RayT
MKPQVPVREALLGRWEPVYRSQLHYLVTWSTRGHKPVLRDRHVQHLQRLIPQLCEERTIALIDVAAGSDHVHVLFGLRPAQSVASAVRELKGRAGTILMGQHPELRVWLGGHLLWDERYAVETVSPLRLQRVQDRLRARHRPPDPLAEAS